MGSDHLQLIKFWPSGASGKGVCGGATFLAPPYYSQRTVFASPPSAFFIVHYLMSFRLDAHVLMIIFSSEPRLSLYSFSPFIPLGQSPYGSGFEKIDLLRFLFGYRKIY